MSENKIIDAIAKALYRLMRPIVSIMVRNGFAYSAFAEVCKRVYVDVANEEFKLPGRKQSASRISLLTGLPRKDVSSVLARSASGTLGEWEATNRRAHVVLGWASDAEYTDKKGRPLTLPLEPVEDGVSFTQLVKRYSGDIPVKATLNELIRTGTVKLTEDGDVELTSNGYVPEASDDQKLWILGTSGSDLFRTIDHNMQDPENGFIQRYQYYDDIPEEALQMIRDKARQQSIEFLSQVDMWLSAYDRDSNPTVSGTGRYRAGIGLYYFENSVDQEVDK